MMFWQEDEDKTLPYQVPDTVIDLSFAIQCKRLPLDHLWALQQALLGTLPWLKDEPYAGIHEIHVAESGNGWERPKDSSNQFLVPSRRTRMHIRIPKTRLADAEKLNGQTLDIDGYALNIGNSKIKPLINSSVIFARHVASSEDELEPNFLARMAADIKAIAGLSIKKMMCGKSHYISTSEGQLFTRHLMIADLDNEPSVQIQQQGLGTHRTLGCGLFLPHKGIKTLKPSE